MYHFCSSNFLSLYYYCNGMKKLIKTGGKEKSKMTHREHLEMRAIIKVLTKENATVRAIQSKLIEFYGDGAPALSTIKHWRKLFAYGRESIRDDPRTGRPVEATSPKIIALVKSLVRADDTMQHRVIAETIGISPSTVLRILNVHLGLKRHIGKWIPRLIAENEDVSSRSGNTEFGETIPVLLSGNTELQTDNTTILQTEVTQSRVKNTSSLQDLPAPLLQNSQSPANKSLSNGEEEISISDCEPTSTEKIDVTSGEGKTNSPTNTYNSTNIFAKHTISSESSLPHYKEIGEKCNTEIKMEPLSIDIDLGPVTYTESSYANSSQQSQSSNASLIKEELDDFYDDFDKNEPQEAKHITNYKEALNYLGPLEQFALLTENVRVVGLINHIENIFREEIESGNS